MKKSLIALSVAAGMIGAAHADTTNLYGALGFNLNVSDDGNTKNDVLDLGTHASRFGIKGTEDLSNGLQTFFKFEINVATGDAYSNTAAGGANSTRYAHLGLQGENFGKLTLGRQDSLWKTVMDKNYFNDVFDEAQGVTRALGDFGVGRVGKAVSYVSPSFAGFQGAASVILDADNTYSKDADAYEVAALYNNYGVSAGAVYTSIGARAAAGNKDTTEYTGLNVGYKMDDTFAVNFGAGHESSAGEQYALQGEYYLGANTFRGGVSYSDTGANADPFSVALGYQYNFSKRTYVWLEGEYTDFDTRGRDDGYRVFVGARHNF